MCSLSVCACVRILFTWKKQTIGFISFELIIGSAHWTTGNLLLYQQINKSIICRSAYIQKESQWDIEKEMVKITFDCHAFGFSQVYEARREIIENLFFYFPSHFYWLRIGPVAGVWPRRRSRWNIELAKCGHR